MGWREQFKAGWSAPPGSWQQRKQAPPQPQPPGWHPPPPGGPQQQQPPQWQEEPAPQPRPPDDAAEELSRQLAESKRVMAGLMAEIAERDAELERRRAFAEEQVEARQAAEHALAQASERIAKFEAATAALLAENEQLQERLVAAEAERDRYAADLAAGMTPALCRRFLRAALIVLHPDKFRGGSPVADVAAFVEARYREIEDEVAKIARSK